jgi:heptosyltransferase-3
MNSILVVRGGAVGDFVLTLPVLSALRQRFPGSRIELLANPAFGAVAVEFGLAGNVRDLGSLSFAPLFAPAGKCSTEIATWLAGFDLIISYVYDPEHIFEANIRGVSSATYIAGPHRPDEQANIHASVQLSKPVQRFLPDSFDAAGWTFDLERSISNTIAIHPGSGSSHKNWPEQNWRRLLEQLVQTTELSFLVIGGEAERDRLPKLANIIPSSRREVALELPLVDLIRLLKRCRAFIGHDSGITHLAAVVGVPCVALWGPTNAQIWKPLGARSRIVRDPGGLGVLPVKTVVNTLNSLLQAQ